MSGATTVKIIAFPSSNENRIYFDNEKKAYVARVKAPADKNKANIEILKLASRHFGKKARIKTGMSAKEKIITLS